MTLPGKKKAPCRFPTILSMKWILFFAFIGAVMQTSNRMELRAGELDYFMDYARFKANGQFGYLDLYLGITRDGFLYSPDGDRFTARMKTQVDVLLNDTLVSSQSWENKDTVDSLKAVQPGQLLHDVYGLYLKPGKYHVRTVVSDRNCLKEKARDFDLTMNLPNDSSLAVSDIQLATHIARDTTKNKFFKNGFRIIPNPSVSYGSSLPVLFYYLEIYNLSPLKAGADSTYQVAILFRDAKGATFKELPPKTAVRKAQSLVDVGNLYMGAMPSGRYQMQVRVVDAAAKDTAIAVKSLNVFRIQDMAVKYAAPHDEQSAREIEYLGLDEESLDLRFQYAGYIGSPEEKRTYENLDLEGKRRFMRDFWIKRDTDPTTVQNEYEQDYYERVRQANQRFSNSTKGGWQTDRGRVWIVYGEPDDIQRNTLGSEYKNYEIWEYNHVEGGVQFVFADESGSGDYRLVHSTATNEVHDEDWQSSL
jgi:GWxTD domain-containing protein